MTDTERNTLRTNLAQYLRKRSEWESDEPIPEDALTRWMNAAGCDRDYVDRNYVSKDGGEFPCSMLEADLSSWWESALPAIRRFVLHGESYRVPVDAEPPWWPVYERWVEQQAKIVLANELAAETTKEIIGAVMSFTNTNKDGALAFLRGEPLRIPPVKVRISWSPAARIDLSVSSPFVEPAYVRMAYEKAASHLTEGVDAPAAIRADSAAFFLAYDELTRTYPGDKDARLTALPEDLRGKRSPNSAAAYFGKLKRQLFTPFEALGLPALPVGNLRWRNGKPAWVIGSDPLPISEMNKWMAEHGGP